MGELLDLNEEVRFTSGGVDQTYTRAELLEQGSLIVGLKKWLNSINPVGRWMQKSDITESEEVTE